MAYPSASTASFLPQFFRLSGVNVLSNLMVPLAGLLDVAFLGHLSELHALAGVALATVVFNYLYWTFGFLRMGTTGMTAQAMGRGDRQAMLLIGLRNGLTALLLGLAIVLLQTPLRILSFHLLSATPEVKAAGQAYYQALIWGAPATLLNFVLIGWFLGRSHSGKVLLLSALGNGIKVGLDYLLIVQWQWQSTGAGIATTLSQYLMLVAGILLVWQDYRLQPDQIADLKQKLLDTTALKQLFSLNQAILIRTFALVSTFAIFTNLSSAFGTDVLAANTLMLEVITLAAYFIDGLAFATESMAGTFYGQNTPDKLVKLVWVSGSVNLGLGILFAIAFLRFPQPLFGLLTSHRTIVDNIHHQVGWLLPVLAFGSIAYMLDGYFLGLTAGHLLQRSSLIATTIGFAPLAIAAWALHNPAILWPALSTFMATRAFTLAIALPKTFHGKELKPFDQKPYTPHF